MTTWIKTNKLTLIALGLMVLLTVWWLALNILNHQSNDQSYIFGSVYGTSMSLLGGIIGLFASKEWGGLKSVMGKALFFMSMGLFASCFGQVVNSYYNLFLHVEVIYPSLGDIGFFGNIPMYILGISFLAHASGARLNTRKVESQITLFLIPGLVLFMSYFFFLRYLSLDLTNPVKTLLDFGYPIGQAIYISLAVLTYTLSLNMLGGKMKKPVIILIIAFLFQYLADFTFLFTNNKGAYYVGGSVDYIYLIAYFTMTISLIKLRSIAKSF